MKAKDNEHKIQLVNFEHRVLINCTNTARTVSIKQGKTTERVNELLIKTYNSPSKNASARI